MNENTTPWNQLRALLDTMFGFTNRTRSTVRVINQYTWSYNKSGVQLGSPLPLQVAGLMPGQRKRVELLADGGSKNISKIVVCSMDPASPLMKGRVVSVGTAR